MTRYIWLGLCLLVLTSCVLAEGDIAYELRLKSPYVSSGGTLIAYLDSPDLDSVAVISELDSSTKRLENELEISLKVPDSAEPGIFTTEIVLRSGGRTTRADLSFTVVEAALEVSDVGLELVVGETGTVNVRSEASEDFSVRVDAPALVKAELEGKTLSVRSLGRCEPCTVTLGLYIGDALITQTSLSVKSVQMPELDVVAPGLLTLNQGEQTSFELLIEKTNVESVMLSFSTPPGVDIIYPETTQDSTLNLVVVAARNAPPGVGRIEVTAASGDISATDELFIEVKEVTGD